MRTTIDLPDILLKRAKIAAVERGTTLRSLVEDALERELASTPAETYKPSRGRFPIFASKAPATLALTSADISRLDTEEDERRHGIDL